MSSKRPSGLQLKAEPKRLLIAVPVACEHEALQALRDAATTARLQVEVADSLPIDTRPPDVVVVLGGLGSLSLLAAASKIQVAIASVPMLAIITDGSSLASALDGGFADAVRWPIDATELAARLRARARDVAATLRGTFVLDASRLTLHCADFDVRLSQPEFALLKRLLDSPGHWVASELLTQALPGRPRLGKMRLAARAYSIRKKLGPEAWRLRGHRVLGYLFETSQRSPNDGRASEKG